MNNIRIIDRIIIIVIIVLIIPLLFNQIRKINEWKLKRIVNDIVEIIEYDIKDLNNNEIIEYKINNNILDNKINGKGIAFMDVDDRITVILENNGKCAIKYPFSDQIYLQDNLCGIYKLIKGAKMQIVTSGDGLYQMTDNIYRYKGLNTNNYLQYNNQLWRIMEIGSRIKIISEEALDTTYKYYDLIYGHHLLMKLLVLL